MPAIVRIVQLAQAIAAEGQIGRNGHGGLRFAPAVANLEILETLRLDRLDIELRDLRRRRWRIAQLGDESG